METADDGTRTAASLAAWLDRLTFTDLTADQATATIIDAIVEWGRAQQWRVYRRPPSVVPLPPPLKGMSVLDVGCARPQAQAVAIEVDRLDRQRTVDKLLAESAAGRLAIWVRWGTGPFTPPPLPVHMVTREASRHRGLWHTVADLPAPRHSAATTAPTTAAPQELPLLGDTGNPAAAAMSQESPLAGVGGPAAASAQESPVAGEVGGPAAAAAQESPPAGGSHQSEAGRGPQDGSTP
jgi:hypothetical protein